MRYSTSIVVFIMGVATALQYAMPDIMALAQYQFKLDPVHTELITRLAHTLLSGLQGGLGVKALYHNPDSTPASIAYVPKP